MPAITSTTAMIHSTVAAAPVIPINVASAINVAVAMFTTSLSKVLHSQYPQVAKFTHGVMGELAFAAPLQWEPPWIRLRRTKVDVEVRVPGVRDYRDVEETAEKAVEDLRGDSAVRRLVTAGPTYVAVEPTGGDELLVHVQAETRPSRRGEVERELQRQLNRRLLTLPRNEG